MVIFFAALSVKAQYIDGPDRYFYDEEFDWRWDVRVRISDGIRTGYLTNREANRLYRRLERIERKEWAFQSDGYYSPWEQDEIWLDVVDLNRAIGLELSDWDRRYYGYTGVVISGPLRWYMGPSYDFYRFDKRGYGSIRVGYVPRNYYPVKHVYYTRRNNYTTHWSHRPNRVVTPSRNSSGSNGYSERRVSSSRSSAPQREATSGRSSRSSAPAGSERRLESSRAASPERVSPSERSARPEASRTESRTESRVESRSGSRTGSNVESRSSRTSSGTATERSAGRVNSSERTKSSVESKSSSRSSGVTPSNRSSRSEGSSSARSSSSRSSSGSRSRD